MSIKLLEGNKDLGFDPGSAQVNSLHTEFLSTQQEQWDQPCWVQGAFWGKDFRK